MVPNDNNNKEIREKDINIENTNNAGTLEHEDLNTSLWYIKSINTIKYITGVIEVLLAFRFLLKLLGANPSSGFVSFLYSVTDFFTAPFSGIFSSLINRGPSLTYVFEPASIVAMIVYAAASYGLIKLVKLSLVKEGQ